jgi:hypothetical protein
MADFPTQAFTLDVANAAQGLVVTDPRSARVHYLNHTAGLVLLLCNGRNSVEQIVDLMQKQFGLDEPPDDDVRDAIDEFIDEGLVTLRRRANHAKRRK